MRSKKIIVSALFLIVALLFCSSCDIADLINRTDGDNTNEAVSTKDNSVGPDADDPTTNEAASTKDNSIESKTEDSTEEPSKIYCNATLDDDFTDNDILVIMTPENNFREYTVEDFSDIGCIQIKDLTIGPTEGRLCRILHLKLEEHSKQNVLDAIKILEQRDDVYSAEPNYLIPIE